MVSIIITTAVTCGQKQADGEDRKRDSEQIHVPHTNTPFKMIQNKISITHW